MVKLCVGAIVLLLLAACMPTCSFHGPDAPVCGPYLFEF